MLKGLTVAAAIALAIPAASDEICDDAGRGECEALGSVGTEIPTDDGVPVGTADVGPGETFVVEELDEPEAETRLERPAGDDVLYSDGESTMIVPEESGARLKIADW